MKREIAIAFGAVLRKLRTEHKLSQEKLAFECGITRNYISLLELGQNTPSLETMVALSSALGISLKEFISIFIKELTKVTNNSDES